MCKAMEDLRDESYAEGREEGRAEGREEGRVEGHAAGREEQAMLTARNLYAQNLTIEQIAKAIGFDVATVEKWLTPKAV